MDKGSEHVELSISLCKNLLSLAHLLEDFFCQSVRVLKILFLVVE